VKKPFVVLAVVLTSVIAFGAGKMMAARDITQEQVQYLQPYGPQGPEFGFVVGRFDDKHPASLFIKFPAGADSGWHVHDEDYEAVVIKGLFSAQQQGEEQKSLPVGSYFSQPGRKNHRNACLKEGGDCLVFVHFAKGANSYPTTPDGKRVTPSPAAGK